MYKGYWYYKHAWENTDIADTTDIKRRIISDITDTKKPMANTDNNTKISNFALNYVNQFGLHKTIYLVTLLIT